MINQHFSPIVENHEEKGVGDLVGTAFKTPDLITELINFQEL